MFIMKTIIRLLSFFNKEINEVRRQPRLVLSLILGPFLILLLFGIGYAGERPKLKTALVLPQSGVEGINLDELKRAISANFELVSVGQDEQAAMAMLRSGQVEVVEVIPSDVRERVMRGEQSPVDFRYNEINPLNEQWIQYLGYAQVTEINRTIQLAVARQMQAQLQQQGVQNNIPPEVLVSPVEQKYDNLQGRALDFMSFYAPAVLALILQHIAVTLGSLSLVRERLLGALELFRVAPVSALQVLLGKYLGYTLFIGVITAALVGLMIWPGVLGVPFLGDALLFAGMVALLTLASLGIGFLISAYSTTDSQAVQLSMLVLLLSIFFSGFFLPLENFRTPINYVGYALPLTHAISGFQAIMLRGVMPSDLNWFMLGMIALVTFVVVTVISQWQFRRA
jgi:ABC-2 type transport system permease protein